jgi:hypothetical protein
MAFSPRLLPGRAACVSWLRLPETHSYLSWIVARRRYGLCVCDYVATRDQDAIASTVSATGLSLTVFSDDEFSDLIAFLHALTDVSNIDLRNDVPQGVPSGLTLAE